MRRWLVLGVLFSLLCGALPAGAQGNFFDGEVLFFPTAARTATSSSAYYTNQGKGIVLIANATAITATPSVTFTVEVWYAPLAAPLLLANFVTLLDGVEFHRLTIQPYGTSAAAAGVTELFNSVIPAGALFRITATHADADSITYSVVGWPVH